MDLSSASQSTRLAVGCGTLATGTATLAANSEALTSASTTMLEWVPIVLGSLASLAGLAYTTLLFISSLEKRKHDKIMRKYELEKLKTQDNK